MRRLLLISLFIPILACSHAPNSLAGSAFLPEIEDIPMPDGFTANDEHPLVYDTPTGRIVETSIEGEGSTQTLIKFYTEALPQLGWKQAEKTPNGVTLSFEKEDEKVDMTISEGAEKAQVKFSLYPAE